jgi:UDP-N-acetylmuramate dehydrogenase
MNKLKEHTWFKTGGEAKKIIKITKIDELKNFLTTNYHENKEKYLVIGAGSNILINDRGFDGTVIKTQLRKIILLNKDTIYAEAGATDFNLAKFAAENNIRGFEFLSTIPGTIGGGIFMNAGCLGREIKDILVSATVLNEKGEENTLTNEECNFSYRHSGIPKGYIIVSGIFTGIYEENSSNELLNTIEDMFTRKNDTQPLGIPSVGSVFKNPYPFHAWEVIDKSGFRGYKHKSVMISEKHTNFIIHNPDYDEAKTEDFLELVNIIKKKVLEEQGVDLKLEVQVIDY